MTYLIKKKFYLSSMFITLSTIPYRKLRAMQNLN